MPGNLFIAGYFDWRPQRRSVFDRIATLALRRARLPVKVATATAFDGLTTA